MTEKASEGELLPRDPARPGPAGAAGAAGAADGEFIPAGGPGSLEDAHAHEAHATELIGPDPRLEELTPEWVITRLMREATDYGKRSRQTARVAALGVLAKASGLLADEGNPLRSSSGDAVQKALDMPPEERRRLIAERVQQMLDSGVISMADLKKRA